MTDRERKLKVMKIFIMDRPELSEGLDHLIILTGNPPKEDNLSPGLHVTSVW
jgi:hypothetical protein